MREDWIECCFEDLLDYEQPTNYIVKSTAYNDAYETPVLTAGKSFIKGYTNETEGIFDNLPTIIFDDFTTASQFVNFKFKVKSSAMKILVPTSELVNMDFAYYAMQVNQIRSDTHKRYWISVYAKKKFLLPSLLEQKAIVSKIEELFSDLDKGISDLNKAQDQLKVYRQAVLKKAFEGELTVEWREQQTNLPTTQELLALIKEERQKYYEEQLKNWQQTIKNWEENGKKGKKQGKPRFKPEINNIEANKKSSNIVWALQSLNNITKLITDGKHGDCDNEPNSGYYFLSAKDVKNGQLDYSNPRQINQTEFNEVHNRTNLMPGDICLVNTGATVGKIAIAPNNKKTTRTTFQKSVAVIKVFDQIILSKFLKYLLIERKKRLLNTSKGTAINNLLLKDIRDIKLILPPIAEQYEVIKEIESRLSVCDKVEQNITESLEKAKALRKSILKKCFEGTLLSEEALAACKAAPDYEPASVLLKKIKAEKKK